VRGHFKGDGLKRERRARAADELRDPPENDVQALPESGLLVIQPSEVRLDLDDALLDPLAGCIALQRDALEPRKEAPFLGIDRQRLLEVRDLEVGALQLGHEHPLEVAHAPLRADRGVFRTLRLQPSLARPREVLAQLQCLYLRPDPGLRSAREVPVAQLGIVERARLGHALQERLREGASRPDLGILVEKDSDEVLDLGIRGVKLRSRIHER